MLAIAVAALAVSSSLVVVVIAFIAERGALGQDGVSVAWLMPVAAVLMVVGVSWLLLGETPRRDLKSTERRPVESCPRCEREVGEGWRLCPWCGYRSEERARATRLDCAETED